MKVYKVVSENSGGQLISFSWLSLQSADVMVYIPGQWVSAKAGPLFAFETLSDVVSFLLSPRDDLGRIWLAEARVSEQPTPKLILGMETLRSGNIQRFWRLVAKHKPTKGKCQIGEATIPFGTVFCDKIKLIKRVKDEN